MAQARCWDPPGSEHGIRSANMELGVISWPATAVTSMVGAKQGNVVDREVVVS